MTPLIASSVQTTHIAVPELEGGVPQNSGKEGIAFHDVFFEKGGEMPPSMSDIPNLGAAKPETLPEGDVDIVTEGLTGSCALKEHALLEHGKNVVEFDADDDEVWHAAPSTSLPRRQTDRVDSANPSQVFTLTEWFEPDVPQATTDTVPLAIDGAPEVTAKRPENIPQTSETLIPAARTFGERVAVVEAAKPDMISRPQMEHVKTGRDLTEVGSDIHGAEPENDVSLKGLDGRRIDILRAPQRDVLLNDASFTETPKTTSIEYPFGDQTVSAGEAKSGLATMSQHVAIDTNVKDAVSIGSLEMREVKSRVDVIMPSFERPLTLGTLPLAQGPDPTLASAISASQSGTQNVQVDRGGMVRSVTVTDATVSKSENKPESAIISKPVNRLPAIDAPASAAPVRRLTNTALKISQRFEPKSEVMPARLPPVTSQNTVETRTPNARPDPSIAPHRDMVFSVPAALVSNAPVPVAPVPNSSVPDTIHPPMMDADTFSIASVQQARFRTIAPSTKNAKTSVEALASKQGGIPVPEPLVSTKQAETLVIDPRQITAPQGGSSYDNSRSADHAALVLNRDPPPVSPPIADSTIEAAVEHPEKIPEGPAFSTSDPKSIPLTSLSLASHAAKPELALQIARQLAVALPALGERPVEIVLKPEELGGVRMALAGSETAMTVTVIAERPETIDLLRRNMDQLIQEFRSIGYKDISFSFSQGDAEQHQNSGHAADKTADVVTLEDAPMQPSATGLSENGLDVRV